jgi:hypothetical protein
LIKKTLNIPFGLNERPEAANIDFSKTLEKALKEEPPQPPEAREKTMKNTIITNTVFLPATPLLITLLPPRSMLMIKESVRIG